MVRELRVNNGLKQRFVAEKIGITPGAYGNMESSKHKVVRQSRVHAVADFYALNDTMRKRLMDAWEAQPISEYSQRQRKAWTERNAQRSKSRNHDQMKLSLIEVACLLIMSVPDPDSLCACVPDSADEWGEVKSGSVCELCTALKLVGVTGMWTNRDDVVEKLAKIQEIMSA